MELMTRRIGEIKGVSKIETVKSDLRPDLPPGVAFKIGRIKPRQLEVAAREAGLKVLGDPQHRLRILEGVEHSNYTIFVKPKLLSARVHIMSHKPGGVIDPAHREKIARFIEHLQRKK